MKATAMLVMPSAAIRSATPRASSRSSGITVLPSAPSFSATVKRRLRAISGGVLDW